MKDKTQPGDVLKYCPKCGSEQFLYDGSKAFKCGACGFHFFVNSACAVAAIMVNERGEILLTRRAFEPNAGMLDLPGGFVDPMETVENSLIREVKEELNLDILSFQFLASFPNQYVFSGYTVYTIDLGFVCKVRGFENMHAQDDISAFEFIHPSAIPFEEISSDSIRNIIKSYLETIAIQ
ncbi:MAG: NUDIX domain-containing protein [Carboxylicivirga sp.]|jgi:mutator protein MutT|nr:NUDIX domain-containing protein [Carboxylicivirga sp.]